MAKKPEPEPMTWRDVARMPKEIWQERDNFEKSFFYGILLLISGGTHYVNCSTPNTDMASKVTSFGFLAFFSYKALSHWYNCKKQANGPAQPDHGPKP